MKKADKLYRDMLLIDARKCRFPRLAQFSVKWLWWMADDKFYAPFLAVSLSTIFALTIGIIAMVAYAILETFFHLA